MDNIFVMIPSYRDPGIVDTLRSIWNNCSNQSLLKFVVAMQYEDASPLIDFIPKDQITIIDIHPQKRPGVVKLRHIMQKFYNKEKWLLSVDSHTIMSKFWDRSLIKEYEQISNSSNNNNLILIGKDSSGLLQPVFNFYVQNHDIVGQSLGARVEYQNVDKRYKTTYIRAGAFFSSGRFIEQVGWPDWNTQQEEVFVSYVAFLKGWDCYVLADKDYIIHNPSSYYLLRYDKKTHYLNDTYETMIDYLIDLNPLIWRTYIHNDTEIAIKNTIRTPKMWWDAIGLSEKYNRFVNLL